MPPKLEPSSADETLSTAAIPSSALTLIPDLESAADDKVIESATLTDDEVARLGDLEKHIRDATLTIQAGYQTIAKALFQIKKERLYRESGSFETYVRDKFGYERSHGNRIADSGQILETSPQGDILSLFTSESHFRHIEKYKNDNEKIDSILVKLKSWNKFHPKIQTAIAQPVNAEHTEKETENISSVVISHKEVEAAVLILNPPTKFKPVTLDPQLAEFITWVESAANEQPDIPQIRTLVERVKEIVFEEGKHRTSKIQWTEGSWNPLIGCSHVSDACDNCYAAKYAGTRRRAKYGALVSKVGGKFRFNGKIQYFPDRLGEPLLKLRKSKYFVNSLSDLFHPNVDKDFIDIVFDVMEKANWHIFQVLTKRPKEMAAYTIKRYFDRKPPENIWLGTTTENQKCFDERIVHLANVKAAVRWISCEPLLGQIKLTHLDKLDWVVIGGEKKGGRIMLKTWAEDLIKQCQVAKIPIFFKQWGDFNEDGIKKEFSERKTEVNPKINGNSYSFYPQEDGNDSLL